MSAAAPAIDHVPVAVIGAGPAGMTAAIALAEAGIETITIDEAAAPGGRIWRAPPAVKAAAGTPDSEDGNRLRKQAAQSGARIMTGAVVWSVGRTGAQWRIDMLTPDGPRSVQSRLLLVAIGTVERVIPFPGWTLPGVVSLAGTTILLKSQRISPGRRVVVAGAGPLLASVTSGIVKSGARVVCLADIASARDWMRAVPALSSNATLAARGAGWILRALCAGVVPRFRTGVYSAHGEDQIEEVVLGPVDAEGAPVAGAATQRFVCDALVVGHGLSPATEITRLLRAEHVFDRALGGWRPVTDVYGRATVDGLYVAGDGAGVRGADFACIAGKRVAQAIASDLGAAAPPLPDPANPGQAPVGMAMSHLTRQRPAMTAAVPADTVVCRCEDITRAEIETAIDDGATDINQLKHFTRCGMGPCQGRNCADVAAELIALRLVRDGHAATPDEARQSIGQWTGRTPLRPVPISDLVGTFAYDDIPVPEPAPL